MQKSSSTKGSMSKKNNKSQRKMEEAYILDDGVN